jgi:hypothetical protein
MTTVRVDIMNPTEVYDDLAISEKHRVSDNLYVEKLRLELSSGLSKIGVKNIFVAVKKINKNKDFYKIFMTNTKNDWQEEQIRIACDDICLSFMKKEKLLKMKTDIIK